MVNCLAAGFNCAAEINSDAQYIFISWLVVQKLVAKYGQELSTGFTGLVGGMGAAYASCCFVVQG
jgi:hypothetical protein